MFESFAHTWAGEFLATFFISMIPVAELRVGLPYGIASGLPYPLALIAAVAGNMLPVPFIVVYIQRVFRWLRLHIPRMDSFITGMEEKADTKGETVKRVGPLGLLLFVAIPLPGTGAWTGALVATLLDIRIQVALPCILIGVLIAGGVTLGVASGIIHLWG